MTTHIAIIGSGFAGLHLALRLQAHGIKATLFTDKTPDQFHASQLLNTVARSGPTIALEHALGIDFWDETALNLRHARFYLHGDQPLDFSANLPSPSSFVDSRLYLARLQEEFANRGGHVVVRKITEDDLRTLSVNYSLVVIASGGKNLTSLFARREDRSPYDQPQRILASGLYTGIDAGDIDFTFSVSPGHGEIFQGVMYTDRGIFTGLLIEGIPGAGFSPVADIRYQDDPAGFNAAALEVLRQHAPKVYERVDVDQFGIVSAKDILQGSLTPTVREAYARMSNGRMIMAVGDAHVLNDPIVGQGANTSVRSAWILADQIAAHSDYDEAFCEVAGEAMWAEAQYSTQWANAMLQPPPDHVVELMVAAHFNQEVANTFFELFTKPQAMWETMSNPAETARVIASHTALPV